MRLLYLQFSHDGHVGVQKKGKGCDINTGPLSGSHLKSSGNTSSWQDF